MGFWYRVQLSGGFFLILGNSVDMVEGGEIGEDEVSILKGYYLSGFLLFFLFFSRSAVIGGVCVVCPIIRWASLLFSVFGNFGGKCVRKVNIIATRSGFGFGQGAVIELNFFWPTRSN